MDLARPLGIPDAIMEERVADIVPEVVAHEARKKCCCPCVSPTGGGRRLGRTFYFALRARYFALLRNAKFENNDTIPVLSAHNFRLMAKIYEQALIAFPFISLAAQKVKLTETLFFLVWTE